MIKSNVSGWSGSMLVIAAVLVAAQVLQGQVNPKITDSNQAKPQKTLPARTPVPPPAATPLFPVTGSPAQNRASAIDGNTLTKDQFRALPLSAVVQVQGRQTTKQEILDKARTNLHTSSRATPQQLSARLSEVRTKFLQKQQADLKSRNDKVLAALAQRRANEEVFARSPQFLALHNEALSLQSQYDRATPAEKTKLESRARELQKQLQKLKAANMR